MVRQVLLVRCYQVIQVLQVVLVDLWVQLVRQDQVLQRLRRDQRVLRVQADRSVLVSLVVQLVLVIPGNQELQVVLQILLDLEDLSLR